MTPQQHIRPLIDLVERQAKLCCGPTFGVFVDGKCATCGQPVPTGSVEPPIAAQDVIQRKLRDLRIEEKELTELLATNRALQLQYEAKIVPF